MIIANPAAAGKCFFHRCDPVRSASVAFWNPVATSIMYDFAVEFPRGLKYDEFLARHGTDEHRRRWNSVFDRVQLTANQRELLSGFVRPMKVICLAGAWCGDCVNQCPIFERFAQTSPKIDTRYFDRDAHPDLQATLRICGGNRIPMLVFMSEDDQFLGLYGDRTLAKYQQMAVDQLGPACPTGITPPHQALLDATTREWLIEFERIQLMLRLSSRLRQKHSD